MEKCLVTKLNGVVNNKDLLHIGECVIDIESNAADELLFQADLGGTDYYCEQAHKLGSNSVNANTKMSINSWSDIKSVNAGKYSFHFLNKYMIRGLLQKINGTCEFKQLSYLKNINELGFTAGEVFDLGVLSESKNLTGLYVNGQIIGDISSLVTIANLTKLRINSLTVTGYISSLKALTKLTEITGTFQIKGNAEDLKDFNSLTMFNCANAVNKNDFGDVALLPANFTYLYLGANASISWTSRPSTSKIIEIFGSPKLSNIDKMLQDQAQCVSSTSESMKTISVTGTRTSASDAAVQTLQSKGYTVSITPA